MSGIYPISKLQNYRGTKTTNEDANSKEHLEDVFKKRIKLMGRLVNYSLLKENTINFVLDSSGLEFVPNFKLRLLTKL